MINAENILHVFITEDSPNRLEIMRQLYRVHAWIHANSSERALKLVAHYYYDLLSLDFDLAGEKRETV